MRHHPELKIVYRSKSIAHPLHNHHTRHTLAVATSTKEEAERFLGKEKQRGEILRECCVQQEKALRATLSMLHSAGSNLTDVRGFLIQLMGAWQAFKSQIMQRSTQVYSEGSGLRQGGWRGCLRSHATHPDMWTYATGRISLKATLHDEVCVEEEEEAVDVLKEKRKQSEEQLSQQEDSEREHRGIILRLKGELQVKHEKWLACQRRCDTIQEQLSSWQRREEQTSRKHCTAEEEVTRLREALEKVQKETRELRRERDVLIESHGKALTKMEEDCRQEMASKLAATLDEQRTQSALHLRKQMEKFRREVELELTIDREKNQLLLLQYQRDGAQLQQK
ncbi:leucine-, glutamate- and lysine-rich protein 1-like protein, partial [Lates japonicus]